MKLCRETHQTCCVPSLHMFYFPNERFMEIHTVGAGTTSSTSFFCLQQVARAHRTFKKRNTAHCTAVLRRSTGSRPPSWAPPVHCPKTPDTEAAQSVYRAFREHVSAAVNGFLFPGVSATNPHTLPPSCNPVMDNGRRTVDSGWFTAVWMKFSDNDVKSFHQQFL